MRIIAALLAVKILSVIGSAIARVLSLKALVAGPGLTQRSVHREVFIRDQPRRLLIDLLEKRSRHFLIQQPILVLAIHRRVPHGSSISKPTNAVIADGLGKGTIINTNGLFSVYVSDANVKADVTPNIAKVTPQAPIWKMPAKRETKR